jgi:hypothetical protein
MITARSLLTLVISVTLTACASYDTVLTNSDGKKFYCKTTGYGLVGSLSAQSKHDDCLSVAKEKGYVNSN